MIIPPKSTPEKVFTTTFDEKDKIQLNPNI